MSNNSSNNRSATCCGVLLRSVDDLLNHYSTHHASSFNIKRSQNGKKRFQCPHCANYYSTNFNLKRHITVCPKDPVVASAKNKKREEREEMRRKNRKCKVCSKTFTRNQNLRLHESRCARLIHQEEAEDVSYPDSRRTGARSSTKCYVEQFCHTFEVVIQYSHLVKLFFSRLAEFPRILGCRDHIQQHELSAFSVLLH